uniref:PB1-like domain-containing protein n=1 Tax=Tanacetum cinerariifolium TaxID=118510 RepID=A0A6L2N1P7_TANCI|nr:hypothetical protein [Tanacetum cinerariifolium]
MGRVRDKVFTVNLHHDGIFICNPKYVYGELKQITNLDFECMSFNDFHDVVSHLVLGTVKRLYYCSIKSELKDGIKELKTDKDVEDFLRVGYENKCTHGSFSGFIDEPQHVDQEPIDDPDAASIDLLYKVKRGVSYPKHDPKISWNEMQPVLVMRNDWRCMLVYCGRNVEAGRQALLESNPGSTCRLDVKDTGCGKSYFKRFYICFKGMKDGWLEGCRRVIGLDGCYLKHTCRGELLIAMGRDANNQMYPIAWAVVRDWLPNSEHGKCTRPIYDNFKKKFNGRDPNSWSRAFFNLSVKCPAFENRICESYHRAIILQRHKPIITMLEDIRVYLMQMVVAMYNIAVNLEDQITPTVRKKLEYLKREQRHWTVFLSAYQLLEVRCGDSAFRVNLGRTRQAVFGTHASAKGRGRGFRGGRGSRGGRNSFGIGARDGSANRGQQLIDEDDIRQNLEPEYMQDLLDAEEDKMTGDESMYVDTYNRKNSLINFNAFTQESVINDPSHPTQSTEVQVCDADVAASAQDIHKGDANVAASAQGKNKGKAIQEGSNSKSAAKPVRKSKRLRQEEPQLFKICCKTCTVCSL